jgi:hypothetical protein
MIDDGNSWIKEASQAPQLGSGELRAEGEAEVRAGRVSVVVPGGGVTGDADRGLAGLEADALRGLAGDTLKWAASLPSHSKIGIVLGENAEDLFLCALDVEDEEGSNPDN